MSAFTIRDACLPDDEAAMVGFIDRLQAFEYRFEPDRRIDPCAGADYLPLLLKRVGEQDGRIFIAEAAGRPIGWSVFHTADNMPFVIPEERHHGYIAELFVEEAFRGRGIGRALIAACEEVARALKLKVIMIGVVAANARASRIYEESGYAPYSLELKKYL